MTFHFRRTRQSVFAAVLFLSIFLLQNLAVVRAYPYGEITRVIRRVNGCVVYVTFKAIDLLSEPEDEYNLYLVYLKDGSYIYAHKYTFHLSLNESITLPVAITGMYYPDDSMIMIGFNMANPVDYYYLRDIPRLDRIRCASL